MDSNILEEKLRLYLICGEGETPDSTVKKVSAALRGGVTAVQLRVKTWTSREIYNTAVILSELAKKYGALFLVNDRLDIALAGGADGVHLGQSDLPIDAARKIAVRDFIIGGTARTPELAAEAERLGADYIGCGSAFATSTKNDAVVIGPEGIRKTLSSITIPSVAVGGITLANIRFLAGCGCSGISLSAEIMKANDPEKKAGELYKEVVRVLEHGRRDSNGSNR